MDTQQHFKTEGAKREPAQVARMTDTQSGFGAKPIQLRRTRPFKFVRLNMN
jgi:hypothetical protein